MLIEGVAGLRWFRSSCESERPSDGGHDQTKVVSSSSNGSSFSIAVD